MVRDKFDMSDLAPPHAWVTRERVLRNTAGPYQRMHNESQQKNGVNLMKMLNVQSENVMREKDLNTTTDNSAVLSLSKLKSKSLEPLTGIQFVVVIIHLLLTLTVFLNRVGNVD